MKNIFLLLLSIEKGVTMRVRHTGIAYDKIRTQTYIYDNKINKRYFELKTGFVRAYEDLQITPSFR
jgi:hypothetical protein